MHMVTETYQLRDGEKLTEFCKLADFPNFGRPAFLFANKRSKEL